MSYMPLEEPLPGKLFTVIYNGKQRYICCGKKGPVSLHSTRYTAVLRLNTVRDYSKLAVK